MIALALLGCNSECAGPACEDAWPATRLVVMDHTRAEADMGVLALEDRIEGTLADGADWSTTLGSDTLVVGMPDRSAVTWLTVPKGIQDREQLQIDRIERPLDERFGARAVRLDTDGNGIDELWVSAPGFQGDAGAVYRFDDIDDPGEWSLRIEGGTPADGLGAQLVPCSDVTGDGRPDLVITAPWFEEPVSESWTAPTSGVPPLAGGIWLIPSEALSGRDGCASPWELGPTWWGPEAGARAGRAIVCDTDLTGDGRADIAIGAPFVGSDDAGRVYIHSTELGIPPSGPLLDVLSHTLVPGVDAAGWFGMSLATRRDPDGNALIIGAPGYDSGRGRVVVVSGVIPPVPTGEFFAVFDNPREQPDHFGQTVLSGDFDDDGTPELVIGAPAWREGLGGGEARIRYDVGRAWMWRGSEHARWPDGVSPDFTLSGNQPFLGIGEHNRLLTPVEGPPLWVHAVRAPDPSDG